MTFGKKLNPIGDGNYPTRQWSIVGYPGVGKSTFLSQMRGPILVVDGDQRFTEVVRPGVDAFAISDTPHEMLDPDCINTILMKNMPGANVGTIVIDSLTSIIEPLVTQAQIDNDRGRNKNFAAAWKEKALAMRQLQNAVTRWGSDTAWVYHYRDGGDSKGKTQRTTTISQLELARLLRNLNMHIELKKREDGTRVAKVLFARGGRSGMELVDETGCWEGMPERIEEEVYGGLSVQDRAKLREAIPETFPNPQTAIGWAWEYSGKNGDFFKDAQHAQNSYNKLKRELMEMHGDELTAQMMYQTWVQKVLDKAQELHE